MRQNEGDLALTAAVAAERDQPSEPILEPLGRSAAGKIAAPPQGANAVPFQVQVSMEANTD